ncbi:coxsackievirus and adenovirus receptor homolog isoform X2 [Branchiostoma lanceolatum]|uniref:coxsackievirus and adenovirus receptor homolog isoform X2 n=1 Tax=Branchiostoma lanceolatum TaxID=7740 RepID=UPI003454E994
MRQFVFAFVAVLAGISDGQAINKEVTSYQQFECDVTFPSAYLLNWMRGDEIVVRVVNDAISATSSNFTDRVSIVGQQRALGVSSLRLTDAGEFFCSVSDLATVNAPVNSARQTLFVYTRPTVTLPYSEYVVDAGGDVTFTCTVTSYPSSNVTWEHPDGTRSAGDVLRLRNATSQSQGQYRCSADNGFGTDMQYVDLVVREPTRPTPGGSEGQTGTSGGLTGGVIAAIVVVCAVLVLAGIMAAVIFVMKSKKKHQPEKPVVTASPVKEKAADDWDLTSTRRPQNGMNGNGHMARPAAEGKPADPYFYTEAPPRDTGSYYSQASRQPRPGDPYWTPSPPPSQAGWSSPPQSPSVGSFFCFLLN